MNCECRYLFVYGTLRKGSSHPMAAFLAQNAWFVAEGKTPGRLLDLGAYPGMVEAISPGDWIRGDVFELADPDNTLTELDRYEGCDRETPLYERRQTGVILATGEKIVSWYYHFLPA